MNLTTALLTGSAAAVTATSAVPLRRLALRRHLTDRPAAHKTNRRVTPYLGGIAIVLGTMVSAPSAAADPRLLAIMLGGVAMAVLGLLDDLRPLSPITRLTVETVVAAGVVFNGVLAPLTGHWVDIPLTVFWIVLITNAFNLLDNMDGALPAVAGVSCGMLSATAFMLGHAGTGLFLATASAACAGFLLHNWPPARMFMGDSGSLYLGFIASCSATLLVTEMSSAAVPAGLLLPVFVAVTDTCVVMLARKLNGRPLLQGGTDHLSHRLRLLGLGTGSVATTLAALAGLANALALAVALGVVAPVIAAAAAFTVLVILVALFLGVDVCYPKAATGQRTPSISKLT
ncbi:undecaprenyl/decaprenyl-phosphate alpha-N-acetylglucosaminyl 1-phosphate transferase [Nonomuraea sp. NBC_01738]|uniref:MraY family glycosyltransferase n=1 Tax=Nonomuraea sp. NBC_01738 TaxID=2976003 RepID=UPI002E15A7CB|nr:undecaprenyl/decaprenyl-phosphate alpha-N-acetylglucosaminyl 1-phosphate transferase [Nonomuraea sp. NBC_01738]